MGDLCVNDPLRLQQKRVIVTSANREKMEEMYTYDRRQ
jgi:hypothetical protein